MDLKEIGSVYRVDPVTQDKGWWRALVNTAMNLRVLEPRI
jgi:hypothetical protein